MSTEDATVAVVAASQEAANAAAAASVAATANWHTGGYNMLIPLLIISLSAILVICVDVSTICLVHGFKF